MGKLYGIDFSVFFNCTLIWLFFYGFFIVVVEATNLYVTIILFLASVLTYALLCHLSLPQPTPSIVNEVLGSDPRAVKPKDLDTKNSHDSYQEEESENVFKVFAHRGAGLDAPENSIAAFSKCHEKGCFAVEFDLVLTADDVPVIFHDSTVDRVTSGSGAIENLTWDELQTYDISVKHPLKERFVGEKIALFKDVVELCLELNMHMVIDIKEQQSKIVKVILDAFKSHPQLYKRAMVSAFNPFLIYMIRQQDPTIVCSLAWRPSFYSYSEYNLQTGCKRRYQSLPQHWLACCMDIISTWLLHNILYFTIGISAVLLHKDTVTQEVVTQWEQKGVRVIVWTVNRPQEKAFFSRVLNIPYMTDSLIGDVI